MTSAILLAAGSSTRMGNVNKLLLPYKKKPVVVHVVENILAAGVQDLIVVTGFEATKVKDVLSGLPVHCIYNKDHGVGLTTSIQRGVHDASGDGYMICLSDLVLIEPAEYFLQVKTFEERLALDPKCICLPVYNDQKGNPVIFSAFYRNAILNHDEPEGCKAIVQSNRQHVYMTEMTTNHILQDMDYPKDYEELGCEV